MCLPGVSLLAAEQKATDWAGTTDLFWVWKFKLRTQVGLVSQSTLRAVREGGAPSLLPWLAHAHVTILLLLSRLAVRYYGISYRMRVLQNYKNRPP